MENFKLKIKTWETIHQNRCYFSRASLTSYQEKSKDWDNLVFLNLLLNFNSMIVLEYSP